MQIDTFDDPVLTMPQFIMASSADRVTVENWVRYRHLVPALDLPGRKRRFSLADLVRCEVTWLMRELFQLKVEMAAQIARHAVDAYSDLALDDFKAVMNGTYGVDGSNYRWSFALMRLPDGELRIVEPGQAPVDLGADLIVTVGRAAEMCFRRIEAWKRPEGFDE
ncbi:hypothetical protein CHH26_11585 [Qipengyuania flava]|uniref:hypothetical protein n=1 Tax=Qipengyuania flava TaxID=192812 RepID=UPI000B8BEFBC|nr:hypothetical protein [Qipengyuania flava]ASP30798.1 hypothetical protein CHH26_11585 [Qipengyuania flava]